MSCSIVFWNTEHLSPNALRIAVSAARKSELSKKGAMNLAVRHHGVDRPITRGLSHMPIKKLPKNLNRNVRSSLIAFRDCKRAEAEAERLRNKFEISNDIAFSSDHVFYCEVMPDHPDRQSPFPGMVAVNPHTLCYAYYVYGVRSPFTDCPTTIGPGWYNGIRLPLGDRVPKSVTLGAHGVRCCFWHAPSANNGAVVKQVYDGLNAAGRPFVLFGDLNAEPDQLVARGVPRDSIIDPGVPTRISGRRLDYAITNVRDWFGTCQRMYGGVEGFNIKQKTGSDHMVMLLKMK